MSAFRRLSFVGGSSDDTEEDRRPYHQHRHPHLHRNKKDYSVSPTGGNRPVSISIDPRIATRSSSSSEGSAAAGIPARRNTSRSEHEAEASVRKHKSRSEIPREGSRKHKSRGSENVEGSRRHKSRSDLAEETPVRKHSSRHSHSSPRADGTDAPVRKHSSRSKRHRPERAETAPPAPIPVPVPAPIAVPMQAQLSEPLQMPEPFQTSPLVQMPEPLQIIDMSKTLSSSPPSSGSSMGIVISGSRKRSGSTPSTPMITATPPTPSPLEQARRANTHPVFSTSKFSPTGTAPPPYPVTPPSHGQMNGEDYIAYAVSRIGVGKPEQNSLLDRYRTNFDPRPGTVELSSEPEPVEIGSSDYGTIRHPQRADSGKSFTSGHGEIHINIKRHSSSSTTTTAPRIRPGRNSMRENQYDFLRTFDTVFIIDDSASMEAFTRWADTRSALETITSIATKYDSDGIDIHFLNSTHRDARNVKSAAEVRRLFDLVQPAGITPIAACLDRILRDYLDSYAAARPVLASPPTTPMSPGFNTTQYPKPLNIIILTDGEPTDDPESVIVDAARRLDALNAPLHQVGIQFFQIGDEEGAREALEDLDDALAEIYGIRDMVDYTPYLGGKREGEEGEGEGGVNGEWILKVLMGAVNRRLDRWDNDYVK